MVGVQVQSSGLCVQGPCQSRSVVEVLEVLEVLEMARVCQRGLVGFGICDIHCSRRNETFNQLLGVEVSGLV
jgi:hypothetical protein